jgi:uncharacterized membrane protein
MPTQVRILHLPPARAPVPGQPSWPGTACVRGLDRRADRRLTGGVDASQLVVLAAALATGLVAGAFYTFSSFVMRALGDLPARDGMVAMQAINVAAVRPPFMAGFFGAAVLSVAAVVTTLAGDVSLAVLAGAASYLLGCFGVTVAANVPLNDALAAADPDDPAAVDGWARYLARWTAWNHVRTLASLLAAALFVVALAA